MSSATVVRRVSFANNTKVYFKYLCAKSTKLRLTTRFINFINKIGTPENTKAQNIFNFLKFIITKPGIKLVKQKVKRLILSAEKHNQNIYNRWIKDRTNINILQGQYNSTIGSLKVQPKFSIVVPVYNPPVHYLKLAIESVREQLYGNWELCLADDNSPNPEVQKTLQEYADKDHRIKIVLRKTNGHISVCSNSALALATGDYIVFMDHDDLLTPNCLFEFVKHVNANPLDDIIYSDEDKIDDKGFHTSAHFKPNWAPDNLLSRNYMGHVLVMRKSITDKINGFREGYEGSQDYDLILRATELTSHIGHISKVLYHWRIHELSVASASDAKPYAYIAAQKALNDALERRGTPGTAEFVADSPGTYRIKYKITKPGKVSIIIPTKNHAVLLEKALSSIIELTDYPDYEIILLNNNSDAPDFFALVNRYTQEHSNVFKCIDAAFPFNFSKLMNVGEAHATGDYLLFLNNDVEVLQKDWLTEMVSFAQREKTGAVGVKLLYPDDTIQHAGVVLGLGGAAAHVFTKIHRSERGYFNYVKSLNNYSSVTGACLMCRRSLFKEVGGFEEALRVEYNDIDFCLKLLAKGYYNVYLPDVELYHYESASRGQPYLNKENWEQHEIDFGIFTKKWLNYINNDPFYNPNLSLHSDDFQLDAHKI